MTKKDKRLLIGLALFFLFTLSSYLIAGVPSDEDCPAPEDLESMEVYRFLNKAIHDDVTPEEAIEAFARMCELPVDCLDDRILVESYSFGETGKYYIHLARQFQFSDNTEFVQLHLDLSFSAAEMQELPFASSWFITNATDVRKLLYNSDCFQAVVGLAPTYAGVAIDWTW